MLSHSRPDPAAPTIRLEPDAHGPAGLLFMTHQTHPRSCFSCPAPDDAQSPSGTPSALLGAVEVSPGRRVMTLITLPSDQKDRNLQLMIQAAITWALRDFSTNELSLHQNHQPPGAVHESSADLLFHHPLGAASVAGKRLEHYHLQLRQLTPLRLRMLLRRLARTTVDGRRLLSPQHAQEIFARSYPKCRGIDATKLAAVPSQELLSMPKGSAQRTAWLDDLQNQYVNLCKVNGDQARANLALPLAHQRMLPLNSDPKPADERRATHLQCKVAGHTHLRKTLELTQAAPRLLELAGTHEGICQLLQLRQFLRLSMARETDAALVAAHAHGLACIGQALGTVSSVLIERINRRWPPRSPQSTTAPEGAVAS